MIKAGNINNFVKSIYDKTSTKTKETKALENYKAACKESSKKTDSVEISSEAYGAQSNDEKLTATSGKDTLGITKGSQDHTYVIHFSDSAMVSRAISRGYITVNGIKVDLSDDVKKHLTEVDKQAQGNREKAFNQYIMQHNLAVAQQQGEVYKKQAEDTAKSFEIAMKISKGEKVSSSEEKELLENNPKLYAMAKSTALMEKKQEKQEVKAVQKTENGSINGEFKESGAEGAESSSFEWKTFETQLSVSMTGKPAIQGIVEAEVDLN